MGFLLAFSRRGESGLLLLLLLLLFLSSFVRIRTDLEALRFRKEVVVHLPRILAEHVPNSEGVSIPVPRHFLWIGYKQTMEKKEIIIL